MTKKKELNDQELKEVSGGVNEGSLTGNDPLTTVTYRVISCPCGCGKEYRYNSITRLRVGNCLGICNNDWIATYSGNNVVEFFNPNTFEKRSGSFTYETVSR